MTKNVILSYLSIWQHCCKLLVQQKRFPMNEEKETLAENVEEQVEAAEIADQQAEILPTELEKVQAELAEMKDKYLRMYSEFDNFKRRTSKEKVETMLTANRELMVALLPTLDDFDRTNKSLESVESVEALKEGVSLVFGKLLRTLEQKGLKPLETIGAVFDTELHEAVTQIPAPSPKLKGKIVDELEKGYYLNDKIIRYAKVVIGS
jgi:molecular chaperone GrpE